MKLYILFWRAGERTGDIYCKASSPTEAIRHFRQTLRTHSDTNLRGVIVTGIAEDRGHLSLQMVQA